MASIYDMVQAFQQLGETMRAVGDEAEQATEKVRETARAVETTAGMTSGSSGGSLGVSSTDLGDPRDAEGQMAAAVAAIRNATGR